MSSQKSWKQLSGLFAALFFFGLLVLFFEGGFELLALLCLNLGAFLALLVELLLGPEQFDERLFGAVALLETGADDAQVATLASTVAPGIGIEQAPYCVVGTEKAEGLAPCMHIALLAQRDHLLHVRSNSLGLGHGCLHAVFDNDGRDQVAQQRITMAGIASEFESCIAVAHDVLLAFGNLEAFSSPQSA